MRVIDGSQVEQKLDMSTCIGLMRDVLIALSDGTGKQMIRPVLPLCDGNLLGMMPAYISSRKTAGVKVLSVYPQNYKRGVPSHQGQILVFETETGSLQAIVDAESITGIRTAAVSAAVTDSLARPDASILAILGAGLQGRRHMQALSLVRKLDEVRVWDIRPEACEAYAKEMSQKTGIPVTPCATAHEACHGADIICTLTPSKEPILHAEDVKPGAHINAVGACSPDAREISADLMAKARLFVDWKPAVLAEAGDYLLAVEDGVISEDHILGEVGAVLAGTLQGRTNASDITIFEALGQALEDLMAAHYVAQALDVE